MKELNLLLSIGACTIKHPEFDERTFFEQASVTFALECGFEREYTFAYVFKTKDNGFKDVCWEIPVEQAALDKFTSDLLKKGLVLTRADREVIESALLPFVLQFCPF
ncbi:hypothetical protein B0181_04655 [Moraxella caviae]|uniref:Uncharacterized protein n=1 Tax=Moraxella caviae TaxID=34060 RepID=A0A1T0A4B9_9GAMM|nr:hypothetical protein [Moraxella caviae]OOR90574.1 hypothetical protein B0181_04655 [Moraxella caviae]STZ13620.1 Uncharacterised protein [Moraxella caviae]STZ13716.1 Uncharacterised protein [Moraxella caviae]VEW12204.1 Uncharacterised protein [Moraxella caviae]VEW13298.1 Uncharacterised protein [Moraxella caviae]